MSEHDQDFGHNKENEPEIWDEHRWEEFFKESDKRTDKYIQLLDKYMDHPDRDRIIAEEMGWDHLLDENDDETDEWNDEFIMDDFEEGEGWKELTGYEPTDFDSFENLPLYQKAHEFTVDSIKMVNARFPDRDDESIRTFARNVTIPAAKIAGGFGFGFEPDSIGGNIANCKRGLNAANKVLNALYEIGEKEFLDREIYLDYYERAKEIRDELAIYIVELRERFKRGLP
ncbi:hypothetical protein [Rhodohalobacter sp.]|uniref:hypothetical protein n=1 Tax=Rhodohalobacter sp. TaxID=1974210 RepID=UPI002ACE8E57|nr:hypothetical protein [Rhodohalobacter sp.]MDZ7756533.1 hypothetical protein [Rhodohalobacter sp.]